LLQRDGDVADLDGKSAVNMPAPAGNYYLAIRHRNHLGVMTAAALNLTGAPTGVDLRSPTTNTWGSNARKTVGTVRTMWSGETNKDGKVKFTGPANDRDAVLIAIGSSVPTASVPGYRAADVNMDGVVKYTGAANDRDPILLNIGSATPTVTLQEQLP